jgi:uncharacterized phage protein (TIGR01671 family)
MREIKFRCWFRGPDIMGKVTNLKGSNDGYLFDGVVAECFIGGRQVFYEAYQNFELMQYTGLKDSSGKEIYDQDFIKSSGGDIMLVVWRQDLASFALRKDGWMYDHYFGEAVDAGHTQVVGNFYENPELIKDIQRA